MPRRVRGGASYFGTALPEGWVLNPGDTVVVSDAEWTEIVNRGLTLLLDDLGSTTDPVDVAPSYRDIQRTVVDVQNTDPTSVADELHAHEAATTNVHGIADTSRLLVGDGTAPTADEVPTWNPAASAYTPKPLPTPPAPYYQEFSFASAASVWTISHNQNTFGLSITTFDANGTAVEGDVEYPDANTIQVSWFYPMTGTARVFL